VSRGIVNPRLAHHLRRYFDKVATIYAFTATVNGVGEQVKTWAVLAGHADIPCAVGVVEAVKQVTVDNTAERFDGLAVLLSVQASAVDTTMRVLIDDGQLYDIIGVSHAQVGEFTQLRVRAVS
jgi:hypothetical protein